MLSFRWTRRRFRSVSPHKESVRYSIIGEDANSISEVDSAADSLVEGASSVVADSSEAGDSSAVVGSLAVADSSEAGGSLDKHPNSWHAMKNGARFTWPGKICYAICFVLFYCCWPISFKSSQIETSKSKPCRFVSSEMSSISDANLRTDSLNSDVKI